MCIYHSMQFIVIISKCTIFRDNHKYIKDRYLSLDYFDFIFEIIIKF